MTFSRLISPDTRSGFLVALGTALMLVPVAIGLSAAAMASALIIGVLAVGLGLAGTANSGRGTLPITVQRSYDQGLSLGLLVVGVLFAVIGDLSALALFAAAGLAGALITSLTRYSAGPAPRNFLP
jgi:hypothetical protein